MANAPRTPALVPGGRHVRLELFGRVLCSSHRSLRVLATFHPPRPLPPEAHEASLLEPAAGRSFGEWKGVARSFDRMNGSGMPGVQRLRRVVGQDPEPFLPVLRHGQVGLPSIPARRMAAGWMAAGWMANG